MAESRSQFEPEPKTPPSSLGQILDLLVSVGYAEAGKPDISASEKLAGGLAWCIAAVNDVVRDGTLRSGEQIEVEKRVEGGLKLIGCPHPLETSQIKNLDCKAIFPVVQWLVNRIPTVQDHNGDDEKTLQQRFGDDVGQLLDPNHPSILKSAAATGQPSGQVLHGTAGGMPLQVQARNQQLPGSTADIKTEINPVLNTRAAGPEGSLMGIPGFTLTAVNSVKASNRKIVSCHFSSDGKLLASGGLDKKAVLWFTDTLTAKSMLEEHSSIITDVRFSPNMSRLATSSFDKTVRVWDVENPGYSLRTFTGHSGAVMSLDFHPNKDDLICSCDGDGEIRYWSIKNGSCARMFKGGTTQMRFQPRHGKYLAAAAEYVVSILDVETLACRHSLQGHTKTIHSVCWNSSGDFLASVSEDSVRVWRLGSGSEGECVHELSCNGNKFHSCVFHPTYPSLLVIGCYQSLELWNMSENKTMTLSAHEGLIAALAVSTVTGLVASASHDKCVKLWK